jgi:hypothetical protein
VRGGGGTGRKRGGTQGKPFEGRPRPALTATTPRGRGQPTAAEVNETND